MKETFILLQGATGEMAQNVSENKIKYLTDTRRQNESGNTGIGNFNFQTVPDLNYLVFLLSDKEYVYWD